MFDGAKVVRQGLAEAEAQNLAQIANTALKLTRGQSALVNALRGWRSRRFVVEGEAFLLDKRAMMHILERHHLRFWEKGSLKAAQSFFPKNMTIDQIESAIAQVLRQNRQAVAKIGTNGIGSVRGTVDGVEYQLGLNHGRIGQFFPVK